MKCPIIEKSRLNIWKLMAIDELPEEEYASPYQDTVCSYCALQMERSSQLWFILGPINYLG